MTLVDDFTNGFAHGFYLGARGAAGRNYKEGDYDPFILLGSFIGFFIGAALFVKGLRDFREMRRIEDTPTSKAGSLAIGFVEVCGIVERGEEILKSPLTGKDCVYYRQVLNERKTDAQGRSTGWYCVSDDQASVPFYLRDDTGRVLVEPEGARVELTTLRERETYRKGDILNQTEDCHMIYTIEAGDTLFLQGKAVMNGNGKAIRRGGTCFFITDQPEKDILSDLRKGVYLEVYGGAGLSLICLAVILFYFRAM